MKRVFIVVEGKTEQEFVISVLAPYLFDRGVQSVKPILIRTSKMQKGGFVNFDHLKNSVVRLLNEKDVVVTTFVDFFRIPNNIPFYIECISGNNDREKVCRLEQSIDGVINDSRFFSYIQLHEFEALLFSDMKGFEYLYPGLHKELEAFRKIVKDFQNPEEINSSPEGAPSKRILAIDEKYEKVLAGSIIAAEISIEIILSKCPRFAEWVDRIVCKAQE